MTRLSEIRARLDAAAKAAPRGPWFQWVATRENNGRWTADISTHEDGGYRLAEVDDPKAHAFMLEASPDVVLALLARVEALEKALEPFADVARAYDKCVEGALPNEPYHAAFVGLPKINRASFEAARAALESPDA